MSRSWPMGARRGRIGPAPFQSRWGVLKRQGAGAGVSPGWALWPWWPWACLWPAPVTAASRGRLPQPGAAPDLAGRAASPGGMGGDAGADGPRGRIKSLGLVFEDESKGCYSSGETVAGHVLLEAAEPVTLRGLRLEAQGRATSAWGPSAGAWVCIGGTAPAASSEVEYLNLRLSLLEAPAGEHGDLQGRGRKGVKASLYYNLENTSFPFAFSFHLSEPLATSFTGKYGSIQYCVRAVLERPQVPDQSIRRELQVVSHVDVNTPPLL
ncbi:hypothetical protein A6R68_17962, partial [Neotoma lepida]